MSGFEVLSAAAASFQLVGIAKTCLSICKNVRNLGLQAQEHPDAHFNLFVQIRRFERWCSTLNIQHMVIIQNERPNDRNHTNELEAFEMALTSQLRLQSQQLIDLTLAALEGMCDKFTDAAAVLSKYSQIAERRIPDHPSELPETFSISTVGFQSKRDAIKLYSRPDTHVKLPSPPQEGDVPMITELVKKVNYKPQFDIYSLGLVLLEMGL
ncbi:hypothetical protein B0T17DRAFT_617249 [Bombardia bombarda]|uniref:Prion-inhibition and propagation HeLo domain-containing protein n=1 Tax=Bombardia bombarda TaxID=252184 RepID=A0AA39X0N5_9PEZI|nr:hypothetical protein B0T17DRAFT_617249 [Bombardia bombarda]